MTSIGVKRLFLLSIIVTASGLISPAVALAAGIAFGLLLPHPFAAESRDLSRVLLQASVVALGFGMNLHQVVHAGASGFIYTAISIVSAILLGTLLGRLLNVLERDHRFASLRSDEADFQNFVRTVATRGGNGNGITHFLADQRLGQR